MTVTFDDVAAARTLLDGHVLRTPTVPSPALSALTGARVHVKLETLQVTNAFKVRGAYCRLARLSTAERARGVIALSAGNHAQAVAWHARDLAIPATIVMPQTTPYTKLERTRSYGAEVVLAGDTLSEAQTVMEELIARRGLVPVHPYDDADVIAGQGTVALEMLDDVPDLDLLVVPVGGGGLISGMAVAARALNPAIGIVGVEAALYPAMERALRGAAPEGGGATLAEGIAVKNVGRLTLELCRRHVDRIHLVEEDDIERAIMIYLSEQKLLAEGAGAAGLAAMLAEPAAFAGRKVGLVLSGGNIDPRMLASVVFRQLERDQRIVSLRVQIDDRPGILGRIATLLGQAGANILEVHHGRSHLDVPAKGAELDIKIETRDASHAQDIMAMLAGQDFVARVSLAPSQR